MSASHPAIGLITAGRVTEAIAYLTALRDPRMAGAIELLRNGFPDYATWILEDLPPHVVARAGEAA